jgi:hypothetical protein
MSKTIIIHIPTGREFESDNRVTRCPFGKNRKMKPTDSIYNEVCDGCQDNLGGRQNSQEKVNRCYYEKQKR